MFIELYGFALLTSLFEGEAPIKTSEIKNARAKSVNTRRGLVIEINRLIAKNRWSNYYMEKRIEKRGYDEFYYAVSRPESFLNLLV